MIARRSFFKSLIAAIILSPVVCRIVEGMEPTLQKRDLFPAPTSELTQDFLDHYADELIKETQRVWEFELLQHMKHLPI